MAENIFFKRESLKKCGENVIIGKTVRIRQPELVEIGDNCIIDDFTLISGRVHLGDYVHIGSSCSLQAGMAGISIESFTGIGAGVRIFAVSSDFIRCSFDSACYPRDLIYGAIEKQVSISEHSLIGANSVVLPGVFLPAGFACAALSKIEANRVYKPWTLLQQNPEIECRRIHKDKLIASTKKLWGTS